MYKATLLNLGTDATSASSGLGRNNLGELSKDALLGLLERFRNLDHLQNFEADPEIILESRRRKRIVRVDQGKLCLYDPSNILASALVLTPAEIIVELDGGASTGPAHSRFQAPLLVANLLGRPRASPSVLPLRPRRRALLAGVALGLACYLAYPRFLAGEGDATRGFAPLEKASLPAGVVGVYMTGNQPGDHGIVLAAEGEMKLFRLNGSGAPSLLRDTYRLGRIDGVLCALGHQPGGLIWLNGKNALTFCGESYQRIP